MRKLPVDISTFSRLRQLNYLYIDKTEYMYRMITGGNRYFLSRPRRFGKSLLVSTLKEILTGNRDLFNDLWINSSDYEWHKHGVVEFDFSKLVVDDYESFVQSLDHALHKIARFYGIELNPKFIQPELILDDIVTALSERFGYVAILVDEYDSPLLKTLHNQELAKKIRDKIQQFFSTIKALDAYVQFVFITGVSSFAKAGLFSGINNLQILTLNKEYAAMCGYTDEEIDHYFPEYITAWAHKDGISYDDLRGQIKSWYNGYSFGWNVPKVYNPFSVLNAFALQQLKNFWFQSGTPTFLVELLKKQYQSIDFEGFKATEDFLGVFDISTIPLLSLMFQAGYVTITGYDENLKSFSLAYPNEEVRVSFQKYLIEVFAHVDAEVAQRLSIDFKAALEQADIEKAIDILKQLFAHVPYQLHSKEEKYYHGLLIMICLAAGIKAQAEYSTSCGRIDLVLYMKQNIYVIEIKFNVSAEDALAQIEERRYYEQFMSYNKNIVLLGLSFKREPHNFDIGYAVKRL